MILRSIRVRRYKNILDSGEVQMQRDITCLVGKNESGKSALLEALYRLNPVPTGHPEAFVEVRDYPRREYARDRESIAERCPVAATFELEDEDVRAVEEARGPHALSSRWVTVARIIREPARLGARRRWGREVQSGPRSGRLRGGRGRGSAGGDGRSGEHGGGRLFDGRRPELG